MRYERSDAELWWKHGCLSYLDRFTQHVNTKDALFSPRVFPLIALKLLHLLLRPHKPDFSPCSRTSTSVNCKGQRPSLEYINEDKQDKQLVLTQQANQNPLSRLVSTAGTDYCCRLAERSAVRQQWHHTFTGSGLMDFCKIVFAWELPTIYAAVGTFQWKHDGTLQSSSTRANADGLLGGNRPGQENQGLHHGSSTRVWWPRVLWNTLWSSGCAAQHNPVDSPTIKLCAFTGLTGSCLLAKLFGGTKWSVGGTMSPQRSPWNWMTQCCYRLSFSLFGSRPEVGIVVVYKFTPEYNKRNSTPTPRRRLSSEQDVQTRLSIQENFITGFCLSALISVSPRNVSFCHKPYTNLKSDDKTSFVALPFPQNTLKSPPGSPSAAQPALI